MKTLATVSKTIAAPPERVFAAITNFAEAPARIPSIIKVEILTPGPVGVGTKFKETRKIFGKEATETMEVTEFDPPRRIVLGAASCGMIYRTEFLVSSDTAGSRIDVTMAGEPQTFAAKTMGLLMGWMMRNMVKKCFNEDLDNIAKHVEARTA